MHKNLLVAALLTVAAFVFTGCETTKGLGRDIENLGEGMQNAAE